MPFFATVLFGSLFAAIPLNADQPITVTVWPSVAVAHGNAQLKVFVERNDANRTLSWEVDGPDYYRSSTMQLEGASAPKSWFFFVRDLPRRPAHSKLLGQIALRRKLAALAQLTLEDRLLNLLNDLLVQPRSLNGLIQEETLARRLVKCLGSNAFSQTRIHGRSYGQTTIPLVFFRTQAISCSCSCALPASLVRDELDGLAADVVVCRYSMP